MNENDWEQAKGIICSKCSLEVFQVRDGICLTCYAEAEQLREASQSVKRLKRYYKRALAAGRVTLTQMKQGLLGS